MFTLQIYRKISFNPSPTILALPAAASTAAFLAVTIGIGAQANAQAWWPLHQLCDESVASVSAEAWQWPFRLHDESAAPNAVCASSFVVVFRDTESSAATGIIRIRAWPNSGADFGYRRTPKLPSGGHRCIRGRGHPWWNNSVGDSRRL